MAITECIELTTLTKKIETSIQYKKGKSDELGILKSKSLKSRSLLPLPRFTGSRARKNFFRMSDVTLSSSREPYTNQISSNEDKQVFVKTCFQNAYNRSRPSFILKYYLGFKSNIKPNTAKPKYVLATTNIESLIKKDDAKLWFSKIVNHDVQHIDINDGIGKLLNTYWKQLIDLSSHYRDFSISHALLALASTINHLDKTVIRQDKKHRRRH